MIPVQDKTEITDNIQGEETLMTVNPEDWRKISGLLINLYSNTVGAVIREYSTNALDAHIAAGVTDPIEVILPNIFSNLFVVKDKGIGMSGEDLTKVYAMFGASTKDKSNDFNGSMGLGSKSALTYTDSFTVSSVKDGIESTAIIGRDEDGNGVMKTLPPRDVDEPNGTRVEIPTKSEDDYKFIAYARDFYKWWPEGTVDVAGGYINPVDLSSEGYEEISPGNWINVGKNYGNSATFVMGNVAYRHRFDNSEHFSGSVSIVSFIPNGSVQFSPSRESLLMNRKTTRYVEDKIKSISEEYVNQINLEIESAASLRDALIAYDEYAGLLLDGVSEWKGIKLSATIHYSGREYRLSRDETYPASRFSPRRVYTDLNSALLTGINGNLTRDQKDAIHEYNESLDDSEQFSYVLYKGNNEDPLLGDLKTIDYATKIKPLVKSTQSSAAKQVFDMFYYDNTSGTVIRQATKIPENKTILYVSPKNIRNSSSWNNSFYSMDWIQQVPEIIVVVINSNRHAKFKKDYNATELYTWLDKWISKYVGKITDDEKTAAAIYDTRALKAFGGETDDKYIDKLHSALLSYEKKVKKADIVLEGLGRGRLNRYLGIEVTYKDDYISKNYPLADYSKMNHSVKYINMIYEENNK